MCRGQRLSVTAADLPARIAHVIAAAAQARRRAASGEGAHEVFPIAEVGLRQNLPVNVSLGP